MKFDWNKNDQVNKPNVFGEVICEAFHTHSVFKIRLTLKSLQAVCVTATDPVLHADDNYKGLFYFRATIELGDVTPHNLQQLKLLNQVVFPVSYNDKF